MGSDSDIDIEPATFPYLGLRQSIALSYFLVVIFRLNLLMPKQTHLLSVIDELQTVVKWRHQHSYLWAETKL